MKQAEKLSDNARTIKELSIAYGVSVKTVRKWLSCDSLAPVLGEKIGNYFNVRQVKSIVDHLGEPE
ncbi:DUF4248 domain-containing protein [Bacteroidales bacterium OttesenSCG-928-C03]|nr:DUF4248 domain-containing protein [Bacteroidales bacterium OttesenSCG-928-E04]MDL2309032.1 DUF4248 domain-containing protein [Bacteroidales bacterium OttesenSCG-928-C03]MDL2326740.1 DUF4248 domain-containing protein [Bacteroidales bacterium OttesenSCG-928-A14]